MSTVPDVAPPSQLAASTPPAAFDVTPVFVDIDRHLGPFGVRSGGDSDQIFGAGEYREYSSHLRGRPFF